MELETIFFVQKSVFLLTSSVGKDTAETLIRQAMERTGRSAATLRQQDIVTVAGNLQPALNPFVGIDKAQCLASAFSLGLARAGWRHTDRSGR
jgi:hypothetical protein